MSTETPPQPGIGWLADKRFFVRYTTWEDYLATQHEMGPFDEDEALSFARNVTDAGYEIRGTDVDILEQWVYYGPKEARR